MPALEEPRHGLAGRVRDSIKKLSADAGHLSGLRSKGRIAKMRVDKFRKGEVDEPGTDLVSLRVKAVGGRPMYFRPRTADVDMLEYSFRWNRHLPPEEVTGDGLKRIVELGTNIATSLSDLAHRYPGAQVLGIEPDPGNAAVARRNLEALGSRALLIEAAAWDEDTNLTVERDRREWGLVVRPRREDDPADWPTIPARTVDSLLREFAGDETIDFMYMDVEGGELRLLTSNAEWAQRVRSMTVEVEQEYQGDIEATVQALKDLGYTTTRVRDTGALAFVTGIR